MTKCKYFVYLKWLSCTVSFINLSIFIFYSFILLFISNLFLLVCFYSKQHEETEWGTKKAPKSWYETQSCVLFDSFELFWIKENENKQFCVRTVKKKNVQMNIQIKLCWYTTSCEVDWKQMILLHLCNRSSSVLKVLVWVLVKWELYACCFVQRS